MYIAIVTRRVSHVEQELPTLPEHMSLPPVFSAFVLLDHSFMYNIL